MLFRRFAYNCSLKFYLPEHFFNSDFNPPKSIESAYFPHLILDKYSRINPINLENGIVYLVVGLPRIGKTKYIENTFGNNCHILTDSDIDISSKSDMKPIIIDDSLAFANFFQRSSLISKIKALKKVEINILYFKCENFADWMHLYIYNSIIHNLEYHSEYEMEKIYSKFSKPNLKEGISDIILVEGFIENIDTSIGNLFLY